jgi:hypothetical protein
LGGTSLGGPPTAGILGILRSRRTTVTIRDRVKAELDKVDDEYLDVVERMLTALERPSRREEAGETWSEFLASTYGSMAEAPIERGPQGELEVRDELR